MYLSDTKINTESELKILDTEAKDIHIHVAQTNTWVKISVITAMIGTMIGLIHLFTDKK